MRDQGFFRLKAATKDLVDRCGGQRRAGEIIGVKQQHVSRICQRDDTAMLSIRAKLQLEIECGAPILTGAEAELQGFRLVREKPAEPLKLCAFSAQAQVMEEVGDLCRSFSQAVADGRYSSTDAVLVERELADLVSAIERMRRVNASLIAQSEGDA